VKIEKEKVYIRASKQVRGHWDPKIKTYAFDFCSACVEVRGKCFSLGCLEGEAVPEQKDA